MWSSLQPAWYSLQCRVIACMYNNYIAWHHTHQYQQMGIQKRLGLIALTCEIGTSSSLGGNSVIVMTLYSNESSLPGCRLASLAAAKNLRCQAGRLAASSSLRSLYRLAALAICLPLIPGYPSIRWEIKLKINNIFLKFKKISKSKTADAKFKNANSIAVPRFVIRVLQNTKEFLIQATSL